MKELFLLPKTVYEHLMKKNQNSEVGVPLHTLGKEKVRKENKSSPIIGDIVKSRVPPPSIPLDIKSNKRDISTTEASYNNPNMNNLLSLTIPISRIDYAKKFIEYMNSKMLVKWDVEGEITYPITGVNIIQLADHVSRAWVKGLDKDELDKYVLLLNHSNIPSSYIRNTAIKSRLKNIRGDLTGGAYTYSKPLINRKLINKSGMGIDLTRKKSCLSKKKQRYIERRPGLAWVAY